MQHSSDVISFGRLCRELAKHYRREVELATGMTLEAKRAEYARIDREIEEWFSILQRINQGKKEKGGNHHAKN